MFFYNKSSQSINEISYKKDMFQTLFMNRLRKVWDGQGMSLVDIPAE